MTTPISSIRKSACHNTRCGFTMVEILFSVLIIFMLMSITIVGMIKVGRSARSARDQANVTSIKMAVDQFESDFGFLPPFIDDNQPVWIPPASGGPTLRLFVPKAWSVDDPAPSIRNFFLGDAPPPGNSNNGDLRFSTHTLAFYLAGALDVGNRNSGDQGDPVDGVIGPSFLTPQRDGNFGKYASSGTNRRGQTVEASINSSKSLSLWRDVSEPFHIELRDSNNVAYRYYRWRDDGTAALRNRGLIALNTPWLFGDPAFDGNTNNPPAKDNAQLRSARYAIVAAGSNGVFGDTVDASGSSPGTESVADIVSLIGKSNEESVREARQDNIVEYGK